MKTYTYSIEPGAMFGLTDEQQRAKIQLAVLEISQVCNVGFRQVNNGGQIRFKFRTESQMKGALGLQKGNWIKLNTTRDIGPSIRRIFVTVVQHELGHFLRLRTTGGKKHWSERNAVMHAWVGEPYWLPSEVLALQKRFGNPPNVFFPLQLRSAGDKIRNLKIRYDSWVAIWEYDVKFRNDETDKVKRAAKTVIVQNDLSTIRFTAVEMKKAADDWRAIRSDWKNVPMAY